jgi:SAM-dependent methyltransferase
MKEELQFEISPQDTMYEGNRIHYYSVGQSALHCVKAAMISAQKSTVHSILDFGSGFGRVLRVLAKAFPAAQLTACDISRDAIDFCAKAFRAAPVLSSENAENIRFQHKFDLIWCGTLLTQFHEEKFLEFLSFLESLLSTDGLLVFTTHGPFVARRLRSTAGNYGMDARSIETILDGYHRSGFGYSDYPAEVVKRVGVTKYGICVSKPSWVCRQIESLQDLRLITYTERGWDNHQDSVACAKQ